MDKHTSIDFGEFIKYQNSEEIDKSLSEVLPAELSLVEQEEKCHVLKKTIQNGVDSGIAVDFDIKKYLEELKLNRQ